MPAQTSASEAVCASREEHIDSKVSLVIEDCVVKSRVTGASVPDVDFATFFTEAWHKYEHRAALVDEKTGSQYTFGELLDVCRRVAAGLRTLGLRPGDVVAFQAPTTCDLLVAICGTFFAGGTAALIKDNLTESECVTQFEDAQPRFVFCDGDNMQRTEQACREISSIEVFIPLSGDSRGATSLSQLKQHPVNECESQVKICPDSVLVIIYSSGTTGLPKGVQLTHRNVIAQVVIYGSVKRIDETLKAIPDSVAFVLSGFLLIYKLLIMTRLLGPSVVHKDDIVLFPAPMMHIAGFWVFLGALGNGCKLILFHTADIGAILLAIEKHKPTTLALYPTFLLNLEEHPLLERVDTSSVGKLMIGGNSANSSVLQRLTAKLGLKGLSQVYGMTELTSCIAYSTPEMDDFRSVGKPGPFVEMKVVELSTRRALGPNELGEICVKSPGAFKAYHNNPKATADAYENGFVRTGDWGYYNPDGCFFLCGRLKELIKCMDQQVAPAELEELLSSDPQVRHVVVIGVPHPKYGEAARAYVVPRRPIRPGSVEEQTEAKRLQELVAGHFAVHKHLYAGVEFLESIPRSSTGKILRNSLQEAYVQLYCKPLIRDGVE